MYDEFGNYIGPDLDNSSDGSNQDDNEGDIKLIDTNVSSTQVKLVFLFVTTVIMYRSRMALRCKTRMTPRICRALEVPFHRETTS